MMLLDRISLIVFYYYSITSSFCFTSKRYDAFCRRDAEASKVFALFCNLYPTVHETFDTMCKGVMIYSSFMISNPRLITQNIKDNLYIEFAI